MSRLNLTILLIKNSPEWARLIAKFLELANHKVVKCFNGYDALRELEIKPFNLIIMSLPLICEDGIDIVRSIGKLNEKTPVFFITDQENPREEEIIKQILPNKKIQFIARPLIINNLLLMIDSTCHMSQPSMFDEMQTNNNPWINLA